jgi:thiamine biosynthesis lipoprotein
MSIGLEDPRDTTKLIGVATITNESICGSALHRRSWGDWNHVINPVTSRSVKDVLATWAIAANTMKADGLATALFFVPPEKLGHLADFRYCVFYSDGSVRFSDDGTIKIFTDNN